MKTEFEIQESDGEVVGTIVIEGDWRSKIFRQVSSNLITLLALETDVGESLRSLRKRAKEEAK